MPSNRGKYSALDSRDIVSGFFPRFEQEMMAGYAQSLGMSMSSDSLEETYKWLGQAPGLQVWKGNRHSQVFEIFEQTIRNVKYEDSMEIPLDDLRRDKTGMLRFRVGEMATAAATHWDELLTETIEANPTAYDGQAFFSAAHSEGDSGTLKNLVTASELASLNVTTVANPTAEEMSDILLDMVGHFYTFKDDRGRPINNGLKNFHIMTNNSQYWAAVAKAIGAENLAQGQTNLVASLPGISFSNHLNTRLTSTSDAFVYMFATDGALKPFILQEEYGLQAKLIGAGSEFEFNNDAHLFGIDTSRAVGPGRWQHALRATLS